MVYDSQKEYSVYVPGAWPVRSNIENPHIGNDRIGLLFIGGKNMRKPIQRGNRFYDDRHGRYITVKNYYGSVWECSVEELDYDTGELVYTCDQMFYTSELHRMIQIG